MMIIKRFANALRNYDWLTVVIEILVVVVGIFIALQVDEWNEDRLDRKLEQAFYKRFHEELTILINDGRSSTKELYEQRQQRLIKVRPIIFGLTDGTIDKRTCFSIASSHLISAPPDQLPALDELYDNNVDLITDEDFKQSITRFMQMRDYFRIIAQEINQRFIDLPNQFPDLVEYRLRVDPNEEKSYDGYDQDIHCDIEKMQQSTAFKNSYIYNVKEYRNLMRSHYYEIDEHLKELHDQLDQKLNITHEEVIGTKVEATP